MSTREEFIKYVKYGGSKSLVSFQIGAGAGFDCKLAGKEWVSQITIDDTINAYEIVGCCPLINVGLPDVGNVVSELKWKDTVEANDSSIITKRVLGTPYGLISWELKEQKKHGVTPLKYPLTVDSENVFEIINWYTQEHTKAIGKIGELVGPMIENAHKAGPVSIQWNLQPFELFGLISVEGLAMLALLNKEQYRKTCDHIRDVNIQMLKAVFLAGADFIFLGAPGSEMLSPSIYDDFIIPDSKILTDAIHQMGGLVYSHICSPIEPFLTKGFYNQMGLDLFETLSMAPVGNVPSMAYARDIIDSNICTRGNIGLDVLLNGTLEDIENAIIEVLEATKGNKHIVAASDYLFYDIPVENVKHAIEVANEF